MKKKSKIPKMKSTTRQTFHYFFEGMKEHKGLTTLAIATTPIVVFCRAALIPFIIAEIIDMVSSGNIAADQLWPTMLPYIITLAASQIVLSVILGEIRLWSLWKMEVTVMQKLSDKCFAALAKQSMNFHNNRFGGSLVSQTGKFVGAFERLFDMLIWSFLPFVLSILYISVILWQQVPIYVVFLLAFILIYTLVAYLSFRKIGELNKQEAEADTKRSGRLADSVTNILSVKSYAQEKQERKAYKEATQNWADMAFRLMRAVISRDAIYSVIGAAMLVSVVIFLVGGPGWFGIPVATMVLIFTYTQIITNQLHEVTNIFRAYNRSIGDAYEMTKILDLDNEVVDIEGAEPLENVQGEVEFSDVGFKHDGANEQLFAHLDLNIPAGQRIGLVGRSGSGKTTLTKLLLRFADVQEGAITIDGQNIGVVTQESLRKNVSYVPQETTLFHRSIAENIAYGKPDATRSEIIKAAKLANAWEFIKELPDGLDTLTGERGVKLSGGQRQRVAIARAILKNAPILVMDEATASLDTESEKLIQEAMGRLMKNRTSIVVAHRLSTVSELDRIIVLDHGKIIEDGPHKELVKKNGVYAKLWNKQTGTIKNPA